MLLGFLYPLKIVKEGYSKFVWKFIEGRKRRGRPQRIYIFLFSITCLDWGSVSLSVSSSVLLSVCLSFWLSVCLSICPSTFLSVCLPVCLSVSLSSCQSVCLSTVNISPNLLNRWRRVSYYRLPAVVEFVSLYLLSLNFYLLSKCCLLFKFKVYSLFLSVALCLSINLFN